MAIASAEIIRAEMPEEFHPGWAKLPGVSIDGTTLTIDPDQYFFRYDNPSWLVCDWGRVCSDLLGAHESGNAAMEQLALDYVKANARTTHDPAEVLTIAWQAYSFLFREEHLEGSDLPSGVTADHLRMLTEMATMMALNRVEQSGDITNIGPAWMFAEAVKVAYGIDDAEAELVDELYHGTWFNESRRIEKIKVHAALGGRLVHGCQSSIYQDMAGGCVVPYGTDINRFRAQLATFRTDWIARVRACGT